jgi:uncharacterized membrane protein (UPF0127 family)
MNKKASNTLMSREEKEGRNSFDSATLERNYPEKTYQSFNTTFTNTLDGAPVAEPFGYQEGKISPIEEDEEVTMTGPKEASLSTFMKLAASDNWSSIATYNINLKSEKILKYSSNRDDGFYKDLRFSNFDKKYDLFYFDFSNIKKSDLPYCIANALSGSRPYSIGYISGVDNSNLEQISSYGFSKSSSLSSDSIFFLKKNDLNKISKISILKNDFEKANFICDIAETLNEKIAGLQPYQELKYGSGLIFPYKSPQDVTYHMGTVSFPIDIIFVDSKNKIKKISSNVLPGTLGVFGASDISLVLEISGGASEMLGLEIGDKVASSKMTEEECSSFYKKYKNFTDKQNIYIKTASFSKKISFENFDIFNHDKNSLSAASIVKMASGRVEPKKEVCVYNFDEIFYLNNSLFDNLSNNKFASKNSSLSNFLSINSFTPFEVRRAFNQIKSDLKENKKIVIATSFIKDLDLIKSAIIKRATEEALFDHKIHSVEVVSIPAASEDEVLSGLNDKYSCDILYKKISLDKIAGIKISDNVKKEASKALSVLLESKKDLEDIVNAFKNNSDQYLKNKDKVDLIKKSEKPYNISCKRIAKKIVEMLLKIKNIVKIMNKIKDISTVDDKIESLSLSCKEFVNTAEAIFGLESKINEDNFVDQLTTETNRIEKSAEDVENNINNFSDYISKNILNKRILSR